MIDQELQKLEDLKKANPSLYENTVKLYISYDEEHFAGHVVENANMEEANVSEQAMNGSFILHIAITWQYIAQHRIIQISNM